MMYQPVNHLDVALDHELRKLARQTSPELMQSLSMYERHDSSVKYEVVSENRWLELAFAQMQRDEQTFLSQECKKHKMLTMTTVKQKSCRSTSKKSASKKSRDKAKRPPLPSLAATHPANYKPQLAASTISPPRNKVVPDAQQHIAVRANLHGTNQKSMQDVDPHPHPLPLPLPSWQSYNDPKRLAGFGDPALIDPSPRMLKTDTRSDQCYVVSPTFMIPMPFGSLVEIATCYELQPRDAPEA